MYTTGGINNIIDLEKEYAPSKNSKRFQEAAQPSEKVLEYFLKTTQAQTIEVRRKYKVHENIFYGIGNQTAADRQLLDIYYKDFENDTPIFVYIHGGFWQALNKSTAGSFVEPLVTLGYRVLVVDYNLCPTVTLKQLTVQMEQFYKWLMPYAQQTNASEILFCGHSAGAHLATLLLNQQLERMPYAEHITSFFLISGIYDLRELWQLECANPTNILSLDAAGVAEISPVCWQLREYVLELFKKQKVTFHILVAGNDSETFIEQSRVFAQKLEKAGLRVHFKIFENYDHFNIIEEVAYQGTAINDYLIRNIK